MTILIPFALMVVASLTVALFRGWPLLLSTVEALGFAGGMTLVFFGEDIPLAYSLKATLIVLAVLASTWAFNRMVQGTNGSAAGTSGSLRIERPNK